MNKDSTTQDHHEGEPVEGCLLHEISEPGAYICHWNGDLLRVTDEVVPEELSQGLQFDEGDEPCYVTRISDNPYVPISEARLTAANLDVDIRF